MIFDSFRLFWLGADQLKDEIKKSRIIDELEESLFDWDV